MTAKWHVVPAHDLYIFRGPAITGWIGEVGSVVGQYGVDFIGNGLRQRPEKFPGNASGCLLNKLSEGELGSSVDGYEEIKPAFSRMHLGNVNVEIADRIALELLLWLFVASDLGQPGYRGAEGIDAATNASDGGWSVGAHKSNHRAATPYVCETRQ